MCIGSYWQYYLTAIAVWVITALLSIWFWPTMYERPIKEYVRYYEMGPWQRDPRLAPQQGMILEPEAYRPENPYVALASPSWQVSLWAKVGENYTLIGHANRMANHLVANWHVLNVAPLDTIYATVLRPGKEIVRVPVALLTWRTVVGDIAAASLDEAKIYLPGVTNAKVRHVEGKEALQIATDFPTCNGSNGLVQNHPDVWGMLSFTGSTRPGFSGASYYSGKQMYGIHTFGGIENQGYSASYVMNQLKRVESSDYLALIDMLERSDDRRYKTRRVDPESVEVYYRGRYFFIEPEEYMDLEDRYELEDYETGAHKPRVKKHRRQSYSDEESEAGDSEDFECQRPSRDVATQCDITEESHPTIPPTSRSTQVSCHNLGYDCGRNGVSDPRRPGGINQPLSWDDHEQEVKRRGEKIVVIGWENARPEHLWYEPENAPLPFIPTPLASEVGSQFGDEELMAFESAQPEAEEPERVAQEAGNCQGEPHLDGLPKEDATATESRTQLPPQDHLDISQLEQTLLGLQLQVKQLSVAINSIRNTRAAPTKKSRVQRPKNKNGYEPSTSSGIQSSTQGEKLLFPKKRNTGKLSSQTSIGMRAPDSGLLKPTRQTKQPSTGMVRSAVIYPTTSGLNTSSKSA